MAKESLIYNPAEEIDNIVSSLNPDKVLIVTDSNVADLVMPKLDSSKTLKENAWFVMTPGEENKNLNTVTQIWDKLEDLGATRQSVVINIGGGVVTDLGGFVASTFKRGIRTINFPTTLLGAVDAATGGKTGIDYNGLKNEIGVFHQPSKVIVSSLPFSTLPHSEILSGYAEMIKTSLISDRELYIKLLDIDKVLSDEELLGEAVVACVNIKNEVVAQDPEEKGLRKILNFGHTAGHAFESLRGKSNNPVSHGKAVAHGIFVALILSRMKLGFPSEEVHYYRNFLKKNYENPLIECPQVPIILEFMASDKKNFHYGQPLFTLLKEIGEPEINCEVTDSELTEALEIYLSAF